MFAHEKLRMTENPACLYISNALAVRNPEN